MGVVILNQMCYGLIILNKYILSLLIKEFILYNKMDVVIVGSCNTDLLRFSGCLQLQNSDVSEVGTTVLKIHGHQRN